LRIAEATLGGFTGKVSTSSLHPLWCERMITHNLLSGLSPDTEFDQQFNRPVDLARAQGQGCIDREGNRIIYRFRKRFGTSSTRPLVFILTRLVGDGWWCWWLFCLL
jgi:hypothetical protein